MATLKDRLRADLTSALKARDDLRASTLRLVLSAVSTAEVSGTDHRELTDEDVVEVLSAETKKRREAATAFAEAGRAEQSAREQAEAEVLAEYLPVPLTDEEVRALVTEAIRSTGTEGEGRRAIGTVMGVVQPQTKGRADGGDVAAEVRRQLG